MNLFKLVIFFTVIMCSHQSKFFLKESNIYLKHTKKFIDPCLKESGLTKDMFDEFEHFGEILQDERFLCFLHCMASKPGCFTENNTINFDVIESTLEITDKAALEEMKSKCKFSKDEKDKCVAARDVIICVYGVISRHEK